MDFKHAVTAAIAAVVAAGVGGGVVKMTAPKQQVVVTQANRPSPYNWGDLSQEEVDKLTSLLKGFRSKFDVAIFCSDQYCDALALDFDNAFESAKWNSGIERPISDTNIGINVAPDDPRSAGLAAAITSATDGRIAPGLLSAQIADNNRVALVISRKPK